MMRVVGRNADLAHVGRALDEAGRGFAAGIISGDPGIGKTTVWRYGTAAARARGYQLIQCRPAESETWLSFSGLTDLMTDVPAPILDALPDPQRKALEVALLKREAPRSGADRRAISTAVMSVVRRLASVSPVVIAVDDLHWLDASTAQALAYVLRRLRGEPVLLLATVSSAGPGELFPSTVTREGTAAITWNNTDQPLLAELDQILSSDRILRIRLGPLSPSELHELLRERAVADLAWPELLRLHEVSGGNPLFAVDIARALDQSHTRLLPGEPLPIPPAIADLVSERVSALPGPARAALLVASALAHPTISQISSALNTAGGSGSGTADALLDMAEHHGIVRVRDGAVCFTHPIFSAAIYSSAKLGGRRAVHRRLAEIVRDEEERAWHMALAVQGPDRTAAAALEKAARGAHARGAMPMAARLWELAGRRTPVTDPDAAAERTIAAAECLFLMGDAGRARSMLEAVAMSMTAGRQRAGALMVLATVLHYQHCAAAGAALCRRALDEAGGDRLLLARLHLRAACFGERETSTRVADAEAAVAILAEDDVVTDTDLLACALLARGYYAFLAGRGLALDDLTLGRRMRSSYNRSWEWVWGQTIAIQWTKSLDLHEAEADCRQLVARTADRGDEPGAVHALFHLAEAECWAGRLREAKMHGDAAAAGFRRICGQRWGGLACYIQALPDAYLGDLETARVSATCGLEIVIPDDDPHAAALNLGVLGFISITLGDIRAANRYLSHADELVTGMGLAEPAMYRFHGDYLETMLARGELSRAADLQRRLEDRVRVAAHPWLALITARGRALLCAAQGDLGAAMDSAAQALNEARAAGIPIESARTLLTVGRIRRRRREKLLAREAFQQARDIFDTLPNARWSEQATAEIHRLGVRGASRYELTPTEDRVARLAAKGLTNREIAGTVHISEKTVEAHLSRIFRKLSIRSRRELTDSPALRDGRD